jgi:hypothetical protein
MVNDNKPVALLFPSPLTIDLHDQIIAQYPNIPLPSLRLRVLRVKTMPLAAHLRK